MRFAVYEADMDFFERELAGFLPSRVFDAHCHLWHDPRYVIPGPDIVTSVIAGASTMTALNGPSIGASGWPG